MAEETKPTENGADTQPAQIKMQILAQFIKDMSFENIVAQKGMKGDPTPDINVQVALDAKKRSADGQFEVTSKYTVTSKQKETGDTLFLLELEYAGIFLIENVADDQLHPFLLIECPRMTFPFARRIVHDVIRDGGFPPLNLDNIDWVALYRQTVMQQAQAAQAAQENQNA